jgi:hypothetical protein
MARIFIEYEITKNKEAVYQAIDKPQRSYLSKPSMAKPMLGQHFFEIEVCRTSGRATDVDL